MADYQLPPWQFETGHQMEVAEVGELSYLYFPAFRAYPKLRHGFSTRQGGVSQDYLGTMNFSFDRGDDPEHVRENYRRMAAALGVSYDSLTVAKQTHTTNIREITMAERGAGVRFPRPYDNVDGIMTNVPGITLVTYHADCLPLYLYDPAHQAVALLHAGWRGTVDRIALCGLEKMQEAYGTRPSDVIAGIGPGISAACYETSEAVRIQFAATFPERDIEKIFTAPHTGEDGARHWQLDLALANRLLLEHAGVQDIFDSGVCTYRNAKRLFSHRAQGPKRGLNAAFIGIADSAAPRPGETR